MRHLLSLRNICYLNRIAYFFLFIVLIILLHSKTHWWGSSDVDSTTLRISDPSFRNELIHRHLASYSRTYGKANAQCETNKTLSADQRETFSRMSQVLVTLRQQMIPYPAGHFRGRGIVLTVGTNQLPFAKVNLKMIEHTATRLPVEVSARAKFLVPYLSWMLYVCFRSGIHPTRSRTKRSFSYSPLRPSSTRAPALSREGNAKRRQPSGTSMLAVFSRLSPVTFAKHFLTSLLPSSVPRSLRCSFSIVMRT